MPTFFRNRTSSKASSAAPVAIETARPETTTTPYRHIPSRAMADARKMKLPSLSLDTNAARAETPISARNMSSPTRDSPIPKHFPQSAGRKRGSVAGISFFSPNAAPALASIAETHQQKRPSTAPAPAHHEAKSPIGVKSPARASSPPPAPYRHVPTHAATSAFLTSAGTHAGWHKERIQRLAEHSRKLNQALERPGLRRFNTNSTGSSSSTGSSRSSSAGSVRSIDSVLCATCKGAGRGRKNCEHAKKERIVLESRASSTWSRSATSELIDDDKADSGDDAEVTAFMACAPLSSPPFSPFVSLSSSFEDIRIMRSQKV